MASVLHSTRPEEIRVRIKERAEARFFVAARLRHSPYQWISQNQLADLIDCFYDSVHADRNFLLASF
jgi:hypothetical protein